MLRYAAWITFICCLSTATHGTSYYFSATGNDAASGLSPAAAWKSVNQMYTITPRAGDSLLFKGGDSFSGLVYLGPASNGTAARPIVIGSYGSGRGTILAGAGNGIFCYNNSFITIRNLNVAGAGDTVNTERGIFIYADTPGNTQLSNITIDSVAVSGFRKTGIEVLAYPSDNSRSGYRNVRITNAVAHHNGDVGIMVWGNFKTDDAAYNHHSVYIGHCRAYANRGIGSGINGSGIEISQVDTATIERSEAFDNGTTGGGGVGIWAWDANRVTIQFCESHHNRTTRSDGDGFDLDGGVTNSVMQYNYAHDNDGAGYLVWQFDGARPMRANVVRYNISENDSRSHNGYYGCLAIGMGDTQVNSGVHDLLVYNNTFYKNRIAGNDSAQGPAISLDGRNITGIRVYNNLFVLDSTSRFVNDYHGAGITLLNNNYWSKKGFWTTRRGAHYLSMAAWSTATGQEKTGATIVGRQLDPLLANPGKGGTIGNSDSLRRLSPYYSTRPGSPMIDAGINLTSIYGINAGSRDFFGNALPAGAGYDIGAYEGSNPVSVTVTAADNRYVAYPNPFGEWLNVLTATPDPDAMLTLHDMQGRWVRTQQGLQSISTKDLPHGIYILRITAPAGTGQLQVIKR